MDITENTWRMFGYLKGNESSASELSGSEFEFYSRSLKARLRIARHKKERIQYLTLDSYFNCHYLCRYIFFTSMRTELVANICFTEVEYNIKTEGEDCASFDGFIDAVLMFVNESGGSLEDAVDMENEAFLGL